MHVKRRDGGSTVRGVRRNGIEGGVGAVSMARRGSSTFSKQKQEKTNNKKKARLESKPLKIIKLKKKIKTLLFQFVIFFLLSH